MTRFPLDPECSYVTENYVIKDKQIDALLRAHFSNEEIDKLIAEADQECDPYVCFGFESGVVLYVLWENIGATGVSGEDGAFMSCQDCPDIDPWEPGSYLVCVKKESYSTFKKDWEVAYWDGHDWNVDEGEVVSWVDLPDDPLDPSVPEDGW